MDTIFFICTNPNYAITVLFRCKGDTATPFQFFPSYAEDRLRDIPNVNYCCKTSCCAQGLALDSWNHSSSSTNLTYDGGGRGTGYLEIQSDDSLNSGGFWSTQSFFTSPHFWTAVVVVMLACALIIQNAISYKRSRSILPSLERETVGPYASTREGSGGIILPQLMYTHIHKRLSKKETKNKEKEDKEIQSDMLNPSDLLELEINLDTDQSDFKIVSEEAGSTATGKPIHKPSYRAPKRVITIQPPALPPLPVEPLAVTNLEERPTLTHPVENNSNNISSNNNNNNSNNNNSDNNNNNNNSVNSGHLRSMVNTIVGRRPILTPVQSRQVMAVGALIHSQPSPQPSDGGLGCGPRSGRENSIGPMGPNPGSGGPEMLPLSRQFSMESLEESHSVNDNAIIVAIDKTINKETVIDIPGSCDSRPIQTISETIPEGIPVTKAVTIWHEVGGEASDSEDDPARVNIPQPLKPAYQAHRRVSEVWREDNSMERLYRYTHIDRLVYPPGYIT